MAYLLYYIAHPLWDGRCYCGKLMCFSEATPKCLLAERMTIALHIGSKKPNKGQNCLNVISTDTMLETRTLPVKQTWKDLCIQIEAVAKPRWLMPQTSSRVFQVFPISYQMSLTLEHKSLTS